MRIIFCLIGLLGFLQGFSQVKYYLYLDAEKKEPFYIHLNDTTISSKGGYLIAASLYGGNYNFQVGFTGQHKIQYVFSIESVNRDLAFTLRNFNGRYALVNTTTGNKIEAVRTIGDKETVVTGPPRSDAYALLLAGVVNDSAVLYNMVDMASIMAKDSSIPVEQPEEVADSLLLIDTEPLVVDDKPDNPATELTDTIEAVPEPEKQALLADTIALSEPEEVKPIDLQHLNADSLLLDAELKAEEQALKEKMQVLLLKDTLVGGKRMLTYQTAEDTIEIEIETEPALIVEKPEIKPDSVLVDVPAPKPITTLPAEKTEEPVKEQVQEPVREQAEKPVIVTENKPSGLMINSDCRKFATDADIDKLRIQMLKAGNDANKLKVAEKLFRQKCFTVRQAIALSELFRDDDGRYNFFEAVYPFISDSGNFRILEQYLSSDFYKTRFRSLLPGN